MLSSDDYRRVWSAYAQGQSIRSISRTFGFAQKTIRKVILSRGVPPAPSPGSRQSARPTLGGFAPVLDQLLASDNRTAADLHRTLVDLHGYPGGYDQVRRYVQRHRIATRVVASTSTSPQNVCILGQRCPCTDLCPRERQVFHLLLTSDCEKQMARRLGLSPNTLHQYIRQVYRHFDVSGRVELLVSVLAPMSANVSFLVSN